MLGYSPTVTTCAENVRGREPRERPRALPTLSVVVVAFECRPLLEQCLASLEREREDRPFRAIVVDNASSDGTADAVRRRFPWAELIALPENAGFARANNLALERVDSAFVLFLNPDTVVPRGTLASVVRALDERPEVGMLGCRLVQPDGTLDHACKRNFPTPLSALFHFAGFSRRGGRFGHYVAAEVDPGEESPVDAVNGAMMLVRRSAIKDVGPMDEDYWLYMEDLDWCYRFWQAGWQVRYWPGAEIVHVKGGSSAGARSWRANRAFHRGMWLFYGKHYAASRSRVTTAAVWSGIWTKLLLSAARRALVRRAPAA